MHSTLKRCVISACLVATLALPASALAQTAPGASTAAGASTAPAKQSRPSATKPQDRVEQRIRDLHAKLHITAEQQAQWDQFAQVMRDNAARMHTTIEAQRTKVTTMTALEKMELYARIAEEHAQDVAKLVATFRPLYASLSDQQKRAADQMFRGAGTRHAPRRHPAGTPNR